MALSWAMSSAVRVTSRNCPELWPTNPAITAPAPLALAVTTLMGSLNMTPVRIWPSVIVLRSRGLVPPCCFGSAYIDLVSIRVRSSV